MARTATSKRLLSLLLAVIMCFGLLGTSVFATEAIDDDNVIDNNETTVETEVDVRNLGYRTSGVEAGYEQLPAAPSVDGNTIYVNPQNAQYALDGAYGSISGKTVVFTAGNYDRLIFGRPTKYEGSNTEYFTGGYTNSYATYEDFMSYKSQPGSGYCYYIRTVSDVTFTAEAGATLAGMTFHGGAHVYGTGAAPMYDYVRDKGVWCNNTNDGYYQRLIATDIVFDGLNFVKADDEPIIQITSSQISTIVSNVTIANCSFTGTSTASSGKQAIRFYWEYQPEGEKSNISGLTVTNTTIDNFFQGVYCQGASDITVENCNIYNTGHNAVAVQASSYMNIGDVRISNNSFTNIADRVIRLGTMGTGSNITITGNSVVNGGDSDGELVKDVGCRKGVVYTISGNTKDNEPWSADAVKLNNSAATGVELLENEDGSLTAVVKGAVAMIGSESYTSVKAAVETAADGDKIELLGDSDETETWLTGLIVNKAVTINGNGHTLTVGKGVYTTGYVLSVSNPNFVMKDIVLDISSGMSGFSMSAGTLDGVKMIGDSEKWSNWGIYVYGDITVDGCSFENIKTAISTDEESVQDKKWNIVVNNCTFDSCDLPIIPRGYETFTNNTVNSGSVNVVSADVKAITGNTFASGTRLEFYAPTYLCDISKNVFDGCDIALEPAVEYVDLSANYWGGDAPEALPDAVVVSSYYNNDDFADEHLVTPLTDYVMIEGIKPFDGKIFATANQAYDAISAFIKEKVGLGQEPTYYQDKYEEIFSNNGVITWKIAGEQTFDQTGRPYFISFGRKASHFNDSTKWDDCSAHITEINIVGVNDGRADTLTFATDINYPYEWWSDSCPNISVNIENLTLESTNAQNKISFYQDYVYAFDFAITNCNVNAFVYYYCNSDGSVKLDGNTFTGDSSTTYALHVQGGTTDSIDVTINNNEISGYVRGINIDQKTANVEVTNNTITPGVGYSAVQLSGCKTAVISDNTIKDQGNFLTFHENLAKNEVEGRTITVTGNTVEAVDGVQGYLVYDDICASGYDDLKYFDLVWEDNTVDDSIIKTSGVKGSKIYGLTTNVDLSINDPICFIGDNGYTSLEAALAAAESGDEIHIAANVVINSFTNPYTGDSSHVKDVKDITIIGAEDGTTVLTGGMYIGYDDSKTRDNTITIKNLTFKDKGLYIADEKNVVIENCKFENITGDAIAVLDQEYSGLEGSVIIKDCYIDGVTKAGINLRNPYTVEITGTTVKNTDHNSITIQKNSKNAANSGEIKIVGNTFENWDANNDSDGGRALRIDLGAGSVEKVLTINNNAMIKDEWAEDPADPNFVKITATISDLDADVNNNYWNDEEPDFDTILNGSVVTNNDVIAYYADEDLVESVFNATIKLSATYGDTLASVTLPEGYAWVDAAAVVGNVGVQEHNAVYTTGRGEKLYAKLAVEVAPLAEATPAVTVSTITETLVGFDTNGTYTINGAAVSTQNGTVGIESYLGQIITIVKKASDSNHVDSAAQNILIPTRPAAPAVVGSSRQITGLNTTMEYREVGTTAWIDAVNAPQYFTSGNYAVRTKATSTQLASQITFVEVTYSFSGASSINRPSVSTGTNTPAPGTQTTPPVVDIPPVDVPLASTLPFEDVEEGDWFYDAIDFVYSEDLMNGISDSIFAPMKSLTRGMFVTILYRLAGEPEVAELSTFTDVAADAYYAEAVAWAASAEVVTGYPDNTFGPSKEIKREQVAAILYRYAEYMGYDVSMAVELDEFDDADTVSEYAVAPMKWAVANEIINGFVKDEVKMLSPDGTSNRAQAATMIKRFMDLNDSEADGESDAE